MLNAAQIAAIASKALEDKKAKDAVIASSKNIS